MEETNEGSKKHGRNKGRKERRINRIPGTFSKVQRCFKAKRLTYTERAEGRGSEE